MMSLQQVSLEPSRESTIKNNVVEKPKRGKNVKIRKLKVETPKISNIITSDPFIEKKEEKIMGTVDGNVK